MTIERMIELLGIERECVLLFAGKHRDNPNDNDETPSGCTRDCGHCGKRPDDDELLEMYDHLIDRLKEKLPRVLTIDEAIEITKNEDGVIWIEQKGNPLDDSYIHPTNHMVDSPQRHYKDYGKRFVPKRYSYRYMWRCWNSYPSEEQRNKVKWDE